MSDATRSETNGVITFSGCSLTLPGPGISSTRPMAPSLPRTATRSTSPSDRWRSSGYQQRRPPPLALPSPESLSPRRTPVATRSRTAREWQPHRCLERSDDQPRRQRTDLSGGHGSFTNGVGTTALSATLDDAGPNTLTATSAGISGSANITDQPSGAQQGRLQPRAAHYGHGQGPPWPASGSRSRTVSATSRPPATPARPTPSRCRWPPHPPAGASARPPTPTPTWPRSTAPPPSRASH